jgi:hypothetical protein
MVAASLNAMPESFTLKTIDRRITALTRQYDAVRRTQNDLTAAAILEQLSALTMVRTELEKAEHKQKIVGNAQILTRSEFPTLAALVRHMDTLARQIAEMPRDDAARADIVNEITRLAMIADSVDRKKDDDV